MAWRLISAEATSESSAEWLKLRSRDSLRSRLWAELVSTALARGALPRHPLPTMTPPPHTASIAPPASQHRSRGVQSPRATPRPPIGRTSPR